jgi:WbqC-like protein family
MTIAVMQPYIFPYLGYYQLVGAVDTFVFFDDVNFITRGWINRNRILQQNEPYRFTIPLNKASQNKLINEIEIADFPSWRKDFLKLIEFNYKKAPFYVSVQNRMHEFLYSKDYRLIGELASDSVRNIAAFLELPTRFLFSSQLEYKDGEIRNGQDKVIRICDLLGANKYINPQNGIEIYDQEAFEKKDVNLNFIRMDEIIYDQMGRSKFEGSLSIIDVLMFNDIERIKELLSKYTLVNKTDYHEIS